MGLKSLRKRLKTKFGRLKQKLHKTDLSFFRKVLNKTARLWLRREAVEVLKGREEDL